MKRLEPEDERPLSWKAILAETPVYSSDDQEVGMVVEVLGSGAQDIFHGLVVGANALTHEVVIEADRVSRITNRRIDVTPSSAEIRELPVYVVEESFKLGLVGVFRKHLGWTSDEGGGKPA